MPHSDQNSTEVIMVSDLGPGDGGKGGIIHALAIETRAHTIIKCGGMQGSHGVRTRSGKSFAFSQFGCGTFEGVRTHIPRQFIMSPMVLLKEADSIKETDPSVDPWTLLTIDEGAPCVTFYHYAVSQIEEIALGFAQRGTVGTGAGLVARDEINDPKLNIHASDLKDRETLTRKLKSIREQYLASAIETIAGLDHFAQATDQKTVQGLLRDMRDDEWFLQQIETILDGFADVSIVPGQFMGDSILQTPGVIICESSHGVLTDNHYGFHPHTSKLRTLPQYHCSMLSDAGYTGVVKVLGVFRAYGIRHGAGPFVTDDPSMVDRLLPGSNKAENRYQGKIRVGALDLIALRYAHDVCGPNIIDGLAVTWFDQILVQGEWVVCESYISQEGLAAHVAFPEFFDDKGYIRVCPETDRNRIIDYQQRLCEVLRLCKPVNRTIRVNSAMTHDEIHALCSSVLSEVLQTPVRILSVGPTEGDKIWV